VNYWIFKVNPDRYRIDDRLQNNDPNTTWQVTRYADQIRRGDLAFIWRAGKRRGICAVMKIDSDPDEMEEIELERLYYRIPDLEKKLRVRGRFIRRFALIPSKDLKVSPGLENLSVFHGFQQATNFLVSPKEGEILLRIIPGEQEE
jgi:predicted RNA-binding protein with PUA-like domain